FLIKKNFMNFITTVKTITQMPKGNAKKIGKTMWFKSKNQSNYFIIKFSITLSCFLFFMIFFSIVKMPWTNFTFKVETIFYSFPLLLTISLAVSGFGYVFRQKKDFFICGWFLAVLASLFYALITNNSTLFPDRHIEYLMAPIAVLAVYGLGGIFSDPDYKTILSFSSIKKARSLVKSFSLRKNYSIVRIIFLFVIIFLVFSLASTVYISYSSLNVAVEEISKENYQAIIWISENLDKNSSVIASDHRIARLVESYGFNTTKDETINLWEAENLDQYIDELIGIGQNHGRVTHIIIDDKMKNDVVHVYFGIIKYMTNETSTAAYDKFKQQPFELVYRNESIEIDSKTNESLTWTEVYKVNWTYIEENYLPTIKDGI
ncbi:MAG: hypothetical protein QHH15_02450, partial [Candidatus Thermoplasmatota archaeon]|nr:hypothetical protein [Candidatus Thermoplasmatota archaeon]